MNHLAEIGASRELWVNLTLRELRGKYKRSVLGWIWSLLNPLATMLIFTVVFSFVFRVAIPKGEPSGLDAFPLFLLCGLLPWNYLANSMSGGMSSLVGNANLVKKVYFPRELLVGANVASWLFSLFIEMSVLCVALEIAGNNIVPYLPALVVLIGLQTVFVLGVALLLAVLNVYFRDVQHLMGIVLQVWFYASPIIYSLSLVRDADGRTRLPLLRLYDLNPMTHFIEGYHRLLYDLRLPTLESVAFMVVSSLLMLALGYAVFRKLEPRMAEEL